MREPSLQAWHPGTGVHRKFALPTRSVGSWAFRKRGGMLLSLQDGLYGFDPSNGSCTRLLPLEDDMEGHRLNDGRADNRGRFWVGTCTTQCAARRAPFIASIRTCLCTRRSMASTSPTPRCSRRTTSSLSDAAKSA